MLNEIGYFMKISEREAICPHSFQTCTKLQWKLIPEAVQIMTAFMNMLGKREDKSGVWKTKT